MAAPRATSGAYLQVDTRAASSRPGAVNGRARGTQEYRRAAIYTRAGTDAEMRLSRLTRHVRRPRKNAILRARTALVASCKGSTQICRFAKVGTGPTVSVAPEGVSEYDCHLVEFSDQPETARYHTKHKKHVPGFPDFYWRH